MSITIFLFSYSSIARYAQLGRFTARADDNKGRFTSLDECQRDELGGVEYRALKVLSWLLPLYTLGWLAAVVIALTPYSMVAIPNEIRNAQYPPTNPTWWAVFASLSGYTNTGLNLLNSNMIRR